MNSNLVKRTIFGLLFTLTIVGAILYSKETFFAVFLLLLILGLKEFYNITKLTGASPLSWVGIFVGASLFVVGFMYSFFGSSYGVFFLLLEIFLVLILETFRNSKTTLANLSSLFMGLVYVAIPLTLIQYLFFQDYNPYLVLSIFFIIWINDTGAYVFGSLLGKHKLAPTISPNKTWEGAVSGMLCGLLLCYFLPENFLPFTVIERIGLGFVVVIFGTLGDLFQSKLKRSVNIKDSGNLIPGHGGILDRIDSILFAFPAVFIYLGIIGYQTF